MHSVLSTGSPGDRFPRFPLALKITATSFVIFGIVGLVDIILAALSGRVLVDLNVFGLLIGRGLWRLSSRARWWAIVCLRIELALIIIIAAIACFVTLSLAEKAVRWRCSRPWAAFRFGN